ncbi:uncharacterized protein BJ171DRAFT_595399 [Polychytrium aggregatum]|uniref:uncharacterized protein n=1 Tax=Polychytrium aggregatum TaxID=110093 RepID=UPI0022FE98C8|nr:uncharacterized protein BJ171DRAFT_595399 [Polychytrium aggregatum]KAI9208966.1 hypothetical protein BJ171DRAFT_595399 [Polychytrium aggregatum]
MQPTSTSRHGELLLAKHLELWPTDAQISEARGLSSDFVYPRMSDYTKLHSFRIGVLVQHHQQEIYQALHSAPQPEKRQPPADRAYLFHATQSLVSQLERCNLEVPYHSRNGEPTQILDLSPDRQPPSSGLHTLLEKYRGAIAADRAMVEANRELEEQYLQLRNRQNDQLLDLHKHQTASTIAFERHLQGPSVRTSRSTEQKAGAGAASSTLPPRRTSSPTAYSPNAERKDNDRSAQRGSDSDSKRDPRSDYRSDSRPEYRGDSRPDYKSASRTDSRHDPKADSRYDPRADSRHDSRPESRYDSRADGRYGSRYDTKYDSRADYRRDSRPDHRYDPRSDYRRDSRPDPKYDSRPDHRYESRPDNRYESRSDYRQDSRPDHRPDSRYEPRPDQSSYQKTDHRPGNRPDPRSEPRTDPKPAPKPEAAKRDLRQNTNAGTVSDPRRPAAAETTPPRPTPAERSKPKAPAKTPAEPDTPAMAAAHVALETPEAPEAPVDPPPAPNKTKRITIATSDDEVIATREITGEEYQAILTKLVKYVHHWRETLPREPFVDWGYRLCRCNIELGPESNRLGFKAVMSVNSEVDIEVPSRLKCWEQLHLGQWWGHLGRMLQNPSNTKILVSLPDRGTGTVSESQVETFVSQEELKVFKANVNRPGIRSVYLIPISHISCSDASFVLVRPLFVGIVVNSTQAIPSAVDDRWTLSLEPLESINARIEHSIQRTMGEAPHQSDDPLQNSAPANPGADGHEANSYEDADPFLIPQAAPELPAVLS